MMRLVELCMKIQWVLNKYFQVIVSRSTRRMSHGSSHQLAQELARVDTWSASRVVGSIDEVNLNDILYVAIPLSCQPLSHRPSDMMTVHPSKSLPFWFLSFLDVTLSRCPQMNWPLYSMHCFILIEALAYQTSRCLMP